MTNEVNGAREIALPSVTELVLSSGMVVWIRPVSLNDQRLMHAQMDAKYPLPREADYKIPVPEDQASVPGQTMTDTEAFRAATDIVDRERQAYFLRAHMLTCVDFPEGTDAVVARFLPEIERKRKSLPLPEDDLEAVIFYSVIQTLDDEKLIASAINQTLPVSMSEVIDQLRIFRPEDQPRVDHPVHQRARKTAPRANVGHGENGGIRSEPAL